MARPKILSSYPPQLMQLALESYSNPDRFPRGTGLEIPFNNPQSAQTFRTTFYEFRRALRSAVEKASRDKSKDISYFTSIEQALQGAEKLVIPRINYEGEAPFVVRLVYNDSHGAFGEAYDFLNNLFADSSAKKEAELKELQAEDPSFLAKEIIKDDKVYLIPVSDIPPDSQYLDGVKLLALVKLGSIRLAKPLDSYFQGYVEAN